MHIDIKVPQLPESVTDATVIHWHKQAGERVAKHDNLVDLETDKVVLEVPAIADGVLQEILQTDGSVVTGGDLLARLDTEASAEDTPATTETSSEPTQTTTEAAAAATAAPANSDEPHTLSPGVRRLVAEHQLDPSRIKGSGKDGRLTKEDIHNHLAGHTAQTEAAEPVAAPLANPGSRSEQRVPMTRLRARIAERLLQGQQNTAMLTTFNEVDMSAVMALRKQHQTSFTQRHDIKLGFMSFFVKASLVALRRFPAINASVDEQSIVYHSYYDISIAVSSDRGLVVPVIRDVDQLDFAGIEKNIAELGRKAREGKLSYEELSGGTFTITNGGIFGSMMSTPILNPPQSAILGMHAIQERAVVVDHAVVVRPMMYLALSYDHRIVDGSEAVQFLVAIKDNLEDPTRLLLDV